MEESAQEADAVTLSARIEPGSDGEWKSLLDPLVTPQTPLVVEVTRGDVSYRFEGLSTSASWALDASAGSSLTIKAIDRTLELDLEEKIVAWPGTSESGIAEAIFGTYGLSAQVEPTPAGPDPDVHVVLQRGTDLAFLRALATKWGYAVVPRGGERARRRALPPARPAGRAAGRALARVRRRRAPRPGATRELTAGQKVHAERIPGAVGHPAGGRLERGRPVPGRSGRSAARRRCC